MAQSHILHPDACSRNTNAVLNTLLGIVFGLAAGVLSGMGMGGGTVLIPLLTLVLHTNQAAAQGINLIVFIPASIVALIVHIKAGRVNKKLGITLFICGALGAAGGAFLATVFDPQWLKRAYGIFLIILAVIQFFSKEKE